MTSAVHGRDLPRRARVAADRVRLRPLDEGDRLAVRRWMADPEVIRFTVLVPGPEYAPVSPYPPAAADRYLQTLMGDPGRRSFAILLDERHVGNVGLKELDLERGVAECFIEVGERELHGLGVGRRAMELLLEHAFLGLGLDEITLGVFEFNQPARALYERLGFTYVGTYGWHWAGGRFWHVEEMALSREAWLARQT
jgi:RimJ/RimL family protein N-acetyltransferase